MKKKLLLLTVLVIALACIFAISVSAEDNIIKSSSDAYGELTTFDEAIGNTGISNLKDDGTIARTVLTDGNGNYYTIPTVYTLTESPKNSSGKVGEMFLLSFTEISEKLGFTVSKTSIVRIEFPSDIAFICANNENLSGCANMVECIVNDGLRIWEDKQLKVFTNCSSLATIDISGMVLEYDDCTFAMFENCTNLVSVKLPDAYNDGTAYVGYATDYMFNKCYALKTIENFDGFMQGTTSINNYAFNKCYVLESIATQKYALILSEGVKSVGQNAFTECKALKYVSLPTTLTYVGPAAFHSCTALEFVDFNDNQNDIDFNNWGHFYGCTNLKAVSMPDKVDTITNRIFSKCTNLQAVYLPSATVTIESNGYNDNSAFSACNNMYFVNEPFSVRDADGNFYGDSFTMPARPNIYYFPDTLVNLFNRSEGVAFAQCYKINPVLVMPTSLTFLKINDGLMYECGTQGETKTVVFLGDMQYINHSSQGSRLKNIQYVFANPNDKSTADVTITNNNTNNPGETAKIFFCASGTSYQMIPNGGTYGDSLGTTHFYLIEKETAPTCTVDGVKGYVCFCGVASAESTVIEATGHKASDTIIEKYFTKNEDGSINYFANMIKVCECTVCEANAEFEMADTALFATDKGYSFSETDASSISYTLHVNVDAIKAYLVENAGFKYGIVVSANTASNPISLVDGAINKEAAKTVVVELQGLTNVFEYVVTKLTFAKDYQESELFCQAYAVEDTNITYLGHDSVSINAEVISHAILVEKYDSKEDLEKVA